MKPSIHWCTIFWKIFNEDKVQTVRWNVYKGKNAFYVLMCLKPKNCFDAKKWNLGLKFAFLI